MSPQPLPSPTIGTVPEPTTHTWLPTNRDYLERCIELGTASNWTEEALGRARLHLASLYTRHGVNQEEAESQHGKAMEVLQKYAEYTSDWVIRYQEPVVIFDDLQPTDEGRYTGTILLQVLWARRRNEKTVTVFWDLMGKEVTLSTGL